MGMMGNDDPLEMLGMLRDVASEMFRACQLMGWTRGEGLEPPRTALLASWAIAMAEGQLSAQLEGIRKEADWE